MKPFRDLFPKYSQDVLLLAVDLMGTFVFAVEGAMAAISVGLTCSVCWCCPSQQLLAEASSAIC